MSLRYHTHSSTMQCPFIPVGNADLLIYFAMPMCRRQGVTVMKGLTLLAGLFV